MEGNSEMDVPEAEKNKILSKIASEDNQRNEELSLSWYIDPSHGSNQGEVSAKKSMTFQIKM